MILERLKEETAAAHARTERALPSLEELARPAAYRHCLLVLHGFHASWEPAIWQAPGIEALRCDAGVRRKLPSLQRDLHSLGVDVGARAGMVPTVPSFIRTADAVGAMYVLEGATLGGQVIERHVAIRLGVTPLHGGEYFHGYGKRTGEMWRAFGGSLTQWVRDHGDEDAVVHGAIACFAALEMWVFDIGSQRASTL
ncbi:MAG: biliverdin-producing heme oxygenase [Gemmatimonadota bacterium]|nr:biliverdin-producing heme oxygenase [Gemmatimonadota bacterium]